jgi:photosystem II stability/assembly factor-like uncharacterized protein
VGSNPTPAAVERVRLRHSGFGSEVDGNHVNVRAVLVLSISAALAAAAAPPAAAPPGWSAHGPEGGTVSAVELDRRRPSVLYAGTLGAGMFKSTDGGATWRRSSRGLPPDTLVLSLELAPSDPSTLYLRAASPAILYRSTDSGASWSPLAGMPTSISDFAVDPRRASTLYVVGHEGLFRSTDRGASWTQVPGPRTPSRIAVAPGALYVTEPSGVLRSTDDGASWSLRSRWPTHFAVLAVDPTAGDRVYASSTDGLHASIDAQRRGV